MPHEASADEAPALKRSAESEQPRRVRVLWSLLCVALVLPGCKGCGTTHFDRVPVTGVLSCPPTPQNKSRWLVRPIVVDLTDSDAHVRRVFDGWSGWTRARTLSLPDGRHSWTARFGQCARSPGARWRCSKVDWFATRTLEIDPRDSGASIIVPAAPSSACEDAEPRPDR